ncbi:MAG: universal stress protein [Bacteroidia bacterium]|nr:universal stress protein [Bacteroidia bacterium]MDW8235711.1 universal stress protein [Bacteroidia bacterium]
MKSVLHLTDFSEAAHNAYSYALQLCRHTGADLHVAHIYDRPYASIAYQGGLSAIIDAELDNKIRSALRESLGQYITSIKDGVKVYAHLWGDLTIWRPDTYLDKVPQVELIVMGTRGATSLWHGGIFGTNTARLIRHSPIPVLAVHPKNSYAPFQKVLLPVDIYDDKTIPFLQKSIEILKPWQAVSIMLLIINTPYVFYDTPSIDKFLKEVEEQTKHTSLTLRVYNDISVEEGLRQAVEAENADLIVMGTHARKGLAQLLFGSITENVAQYIAHPLLAVPL